jgi:hypothetical protein
MYIAVTDPDVLLACTYYYTLVSILFSTNRFAYKLIHNNDTEKELLEIKSQCECGMRAKYIV